MRELCVGCDGRICVGRGRHKSDAYAWDAADACQRICVGLDRRKLDCFKKNIKSISASILRLLSFLREFLAILTDDNSV